MRRPATPAWWVLAACAGLGACDTLPPGDPPPGGQGAGQTAGIEEWRGRTIGGEPLLQSTMLHTAIMLTGWDSIEVASQSDESGTVTARVDFISKSEGAAYGSAVPVAKDGYFLTAGHCVDGQHPTLVTFEIKAGNYHMVKADARVIWRGDGASGEPDLALIHAPVRVGKVFRLVDFNKLRSREAIAATGWSGISKGRPLSVSAAGRILAVSEPIGEAPDLVWHAIRHDLPIRPGDSGGPLIDWNGKLVGINAGLGLSPLNRLRSLANLERFRDRYAGYRAIAYHPDPSWLARTIQRDRARR